MNALQKIFQLFCRTNNDFKADLVLSCGNACRVAHYLHKYKLRKFSSPIDWMMSYSLEAVNNMFEEDFAYFFKDYEQMYEHNNMRVVKDKRNNMVAMHDFVMQKSIEEQYPHFIEQKTKRFKRLKKELLKARSVIFLCNRSENLQNFKDFLIRMYNFHKAKYTLINIHHQEKLHKIQRKDYEVMPRSINGGGGGCRIIEFYFDDTHPQGQNHPKFWHGNEEKWGEIMPLIKLNTIIKDKVGYFM